MFERIWVVTWKETIDNLRDRRSVMNTLGTVLFNPIFYIVLFGFLNRSFSERAEQQLHLPVMGGENAPNLVRFLENNDVAVYPAPADAEAQVRAGNLDVVLVIPEDYGELFSAGETATVELMVDESNQSAGVTLDRTEELLQRYGLRVGSLRLLARGISPVIMLPVTVETVDISTEGRGSDGFALNLLPTVMITAAFFGGFFLAVDMTAGERERESIEPLLTNPVPRWMIVIGKFTAAFVFTILATALATGLFTALLSAPQVQDWTNIRVSLAPGVVATAVLLMLPVVFAAVALEMLIASYARSFKEAQTYVQIVAMIGFLPTIFLSVLPIQQQSWMAFVPTVSQLYLIQSLSRGEPLDMGNAVVASIITLLIGVIALVAAVNLYNQERIILGGASS